MRCIYLYATETLFVIYGAYRVAARSSTRHFDISFLHAYSYCVALIYGMYCMAVLLLHVGFLLIPLERGGELCPN